MAAAHPPHVSLKRFAGLPNENWDQFEGLLRASIAVARIPADHNQQARYLHLHLDGNALNYYLRLPENTRNDLDDALEQLRNRYSGPDQRRNFELDLQSRKFDPVKEQPDDFLSDLQRLANLAIVDDVGAGIDRNAERTRRIREQFIQDALQIQKSSSQRIGQCRSKRLMLHSQKTTSNRPIKPRASTHHSLQLTNKLTKLCF